MPDSLFYKVAGLRPTTLLKKTLWHRCFLVKVAIFLRAPFFTEHPWWLLLKRLKTVNYFRKTSIQDVRLGSEYAFTLSLFLFSLIFNIKGAL